MEIFILFCMVFMYVLSDYNMQGVLLQLLCPNCHAFTDNYRGKNVGKNK